MPTHLVSIIFVIKATFSVHKLITKNAQMTTLYTNWSLYITVTMIYYIRQVALLIILLQDQWKEANAKKAKEPTKNSKEAHD